MATRIYVSFSPRKLGEDDPIWQAYFSNGLVQPPTRFLRCFLSHQLTGKVITKVQTPLGERLQRRRSHSKWWWKWKKLLWAYRWFRPWKALKAVSLYYIYVHMFTFLNECIYTWYWYTYAYIRYMLKILKIDNDIRRCRYSFSRKLLREQDCFQIFFGLPKNLWIYVPFVELSLKESPWNSIMWSRCQVIGSSSLMTSPLMAKRLVHVTAAMFGALKVVLHGRNFPWKVISHGRLAVSLLKSLQKRTYRQVRSMVLANVKVSWIQEALWCRILRFLFGHHSQMEGPNRFACFRNQYQKWKKMMDLKHSAGFYPTEVQKTPSNHRVLLELVFWMEDLCFGTMIWIPVISNNTLRLVFLGGCWFLHRFENPTEKERCCVTLLYFFVSSGLTNLLNDQTNPMTWFQNNVDTFVLRRQGWVPNMTWTPYCHGWTFRQWKNGWFIET